MKPLKPDDQSEAGEIADYGDYLMTGDGVLAQNHQGAGYAFSCLFWINLCKTHREDLPRRFSVELKKRRTNNFSNCIRVLEKLTGKNDLGERLGQMNLRRALDSRF